MQGGIRTGLKRFGPPFGIYLATLLGERALNSAKFAWIWAVLPYFAATWAILSLVAYSDKWWQRLFGWAEGFRRWIPRIRVEWPRGSTSDEPLPTRVEWVSAAEQAAADAAVVSPEASSGPVLVPENEFEVTHKKDKHGTLVMRVRNLKDEPKTGYVARIVDLRVWSQSLRNHDGTEGGFAGYPPFLARKRPIDLPEIGGRSGILDHMEPKTFELIRQFEPWQVRGKDGNMVLRDGVWRFIVELAWNAGALSFPYEIRLRTPSKRIKVADFVQPRVPSSSI